MIGKGLSCASAVFIVIGYRLQEFRSGLLTLYHTYRIMNILQGELFLRTFAGNEKMLVISNFSFSQVFYPFKDKLSFG